MFRALFVLSIMLPLTVIGGCIELVIILFTFPFRLVKNDVLHRVNAFWGWVFFKVAGSKLAVSGREYYDPKKPYIIMMNHQSSFDIFLLFAVLPGQFRWISKDTYFKYPIIGWSMKHSGYISIVREKMKSAYDSILAAGKRLEEGRSVAIFPEGTRSLDGVIRRFKPGILILTEQYPDIPILPVVIDGTGRMMKKGSFSIQKTDVRVRILPPYCIKGIPGDRNAKIGHLEAMMRTVHESMMRETPR
ncbi:MAG: 1-acyl-sn-glycerol-3-phosphate acyltransferase [Spirochaetes bacterium]|nr:1-acyl-sn-glycerol-3-phosphate acyltransferase [Spirochaetota bacterium]